jgi:hypothetical protein
MIYQVQMQFIPGSDQIWVARLSPDDPIYEYPTQEEAQLKADELKLADPTDRQYRVMQIG